MIAREALTHEQIIVKRKSESHFSHSQGNPPFLIGKLLADQKTLRYTLDIDALMCERLDVQELERVNTLALFFSGKGLMKGNDMQYKGKYKIAVSVAALVLSGALWMPIVKAAPASDGTYYIDNGKYISVSPRSDVTSTKYVITNLDGSIPATQPADLWNPDNSLNTTKYAAVKADGVHSIQYLSQTGYTNRYNVGAPSGYDALINATTNQIVRSNQAIDPTLIASGVYKWVKGTDVNTMAKYTDAVVFSAPTTFKYDVPANVEAKRDSSGALVSLWASNGREYLNSTGDKTTIGAAGLTTTGDVKAGDVSLKAVGAQVSALSGVGGAVTEQGGRIGSLETKTQSITGDTNGIIVNGAAKANSFTASSTTGGVTSTTVVDGNGLRFDDGKGGSVTIKDPTIIVTNGASTTTIHNGDVTNTGDTNTGGKLTVAGATILNGGATVVGNTKTTTLTVTGNSSVGGNHSVAGNSSVGGSLSVTGPAAISGPLYVGGFGGNVYSGGYSDVSSALNGYGVMLDQQGGQIASLNDWRNVARGQITALQGDMKKALSGSAVAMATGKFSLEPGKMIGVSADYANYEGYGAFGTTAAFRFTNDLQGNISAGFGTDSNTFGVRAGVIWQR